MSRTVAFRCDASSTIGFGHLVRCMALADELHETHDCRAFFLVHPDASAQKILGDSSHEFILLPECNGQDNYRKSLRTILLDLTANTLVVDVRDDLSCETLRSLKQQGVKIIIIDDASERRLAADLAFYPPVPQFEALDWFGCDGTVYCGWEWVLLRRQFASLPFRNPNPIPHVLVTMGGSDPAGFTLKALAALDTVKHDLTITVIIGPGFTDKNKLHEVIAGSVRNIKVLERVEEMVPVMSRTDLALAAFGMTAYELAACGVPSIYFCLSPDHDVSAEAFASAEIGISLGYQTNVSISNVASLVKRQLSDRAHLMKMGEMARLLVDGAGTRRVADLIAKT